MKTKDEWLGGTGLPHGRELELASRAYDTLMGNVYEKTGYPWSPYRCISPGRPAFKGIWNWDSAFHAVGVSRWDVSLAKESILGFFKYQKKNGFLPDVIREDGTVEDISSKPPLFAWAVERVYERDGDADFVGTVYPRLEANIRFWETERCCGGLFFYDASNKDSPDYTKYAKWESGWDGSPRWDGRIVNLWAIDLSCFMVMSYRAMKRLAKTLGRNIDSCRYEKKELALARLINEVLWNEETGFYADTDKFTLEHSRVLTPASFMPLYAGIAPFERAEKMARIAEDEKRFGGKMPIVSFDDPSFGTTDEGMDHCYARGPIWINHSYFAAKGLKDYGFSVGDAIKESVLAMCHAEKKGIFENYDPVTGEGRCFGSFSWSAVFLLEFIFNF